MQQYLTLEEAAKALQMSPDELREMAKKKTVRAFQDRGSWRFRSQDIEELARSRGLSSDAELQLGEALKSGPAAKKPGDSEGIPADFSLDDDDEVPIGREKQTPDSSASSRSGRLGKPSNKPGSDSDVRLVMDSEIDFSLSEEPKAGPRSEVRKASNRPTADTAPGTKRRDDDDEAIPLGDEPKAKTGSDSDIRLEESGERKKSGLGNITEEIDLDAEQAKLDKQKKEGSGKKGGPRTTMMANQAGLPTSSPFELSDSDLDLGASARKKVDSDSEFELVPFDESKAPGKGTGELLLPSDDEVSLGSEVSGKGPGQSGINLQNPADSGISLESGGSDEIDLDLNLSLDDSSEERAALKSKEDSSSEFELSLDESSDTDSGSSEFELSLDDASSTSDSSSEFELSLDGGDSVELKPIGEHSDSEFELTLDDDGTLGAEADAQDIFEETNFDVPALEDESGSEAVALDSDLESSDDFEVSLDEDSGDGSQVVSLEDEEEADAGAATVARPRKSPVRSKAVADEESADDFEVGNRKSKKADEEDEDEDEDEELVSAAPPADWGPLPAILLFPSVIVLFVVGLMSIELVRGMWGYHRPSTVGKPVIDSIARIFDDRLPK